MTNLAQYVARSPRYILQPHDNTLIRVAGPHQVPWEEGTSIQNVSLSGLAFTAPADLCPIIGEIIKIQFEVPGREQMACLAMVIRLQKIQNSQMLVAVKFVKVEMPQRLLIAQSLASKLKEQIESEEASSRELWWQSKKTRSVMAFAFACLWVALLHWFWFKTSL